MYPYPGLLYSLDPDIKISDLKAKKFEEGRDVSKVIQYLESNNIHMMIDDDSSYHYKLHTVPSKPYILHYQWNGDLLNRPILAIVGPRKPSEYGQKIISELLWHLADRDVVTISGLADGIDTLVHTLSLQHHIPTIAVLWWGFGHFLRWTKRNLIQDIVSKGWLVLSEFRIKQTPTPYTFPQRNRIIAGLSNGVFIPEAGHKSGSLITVQFAMDSKKPIYTVPQSIYAPTSGGTNELLSNRKAIAVTDLMAWTQQHFTSSIPTSGQIDVDLTVDEKTIYEAIANGSKTLWNMVYLTHLSQQTVQVVVSMMEIKGLIYQSSPDIYEIGKMIQ